MKTKNFLKMAFLLLALVGGVNSVWASTVSDLNTISSNKTIYFDNYLTASVGAGTLFANSSLLSVDGNTYKSDKGSDTAGHLYCCRVKSASQDKLAFKVNGACTLVLYGERVTDRAPVLNTASDNAEATKITGTATAGKSGKTWGTVEYSITAAGTYYIIGSGDHYLSALEFTFPAADAPTITTQPASAAYGVGATPADLTVVASASAGVLSYQWYKNTDQDKTAKEADKIAGATSATLDKANISTASENTTYYYVVVTDDNGSTTSDLATITVVEQEPYATPTITEKNGTVQITSSDDITVSQIKYSLDGGSSWNTYSIPFNLATATTVKAKVVQGEDPSYTDSEVASTACNAIPAKIDGSFSITLYNDDSNWTKTASQDGSDKIDTWTGKADTYLDGYIIALDNEGKTGTNIKELSTGNAINSKSTIKNSNGRRIKFTIPTGVKVNRITIYSYTNGDSNYKYASTWSFDGETPDMIGLSLRDIDANNGKSESSASNPDIRVFYFDTPLEGSFYLNNSGYQQCFYMVLDYTQTVSGTITPAGWSTFASSYPLDLSTISGGTAYYASAASGSTVTLSTTDATVPAGEGIMVKGTAGETFTINVAASGTEIDGNLLKGQTTTGNVAASTSGTYHYVFGYKTSDAKEYGFYNLTADTSVPAGKAYLETKTELTGARIAMIFDDEEATGINNVKREEISSNRFYNLNGQEIAQPSKGLYIVNGKKVVIK